MGLFDKIIKGISTRVSDPDPLHKVTEADHQSAVIKERPDLCEDIKALPQKQNVRRDGARDIAFNGWQICNVHYKATTVDDIIGIKDFFGNDSLALAMMMMLDRISKNW